MSEHTPGPWKTLGCEVVDGRGTICSVFQHSERGGLRVRLPFAETGANAELIARAPDMQAEIDGLRKSCETAYGLMEDAQCYMPPHACNFAEKARLWMDEYDAREREEP